MSTSGIDLEPALPIVYAVAVAVLLIALAWRAGTPRTIGLRITATLLLLGALLGPVAVEHTQTETELPRLALLVDRSISMGVEDQVVDGQARSRAGALRATMLEPNTIRALEEYARVTTLVFGGRVVPVPSTDPASTEPPENESRISESIARVVGELEPGSTLVVLSDGRDTSPAPAAPEEIAGLARAAGVRIHAVPVGSAERAADVSIRAAPRRPLVFEGAPIVIDAHIDQSGYTGRRASVTVEDSALPGVALVQQEVELAENGRCELSFTPRPRSDRSAGTVVREYTVRIEHMPGERDAANNERRVFVQLTGQRIRVLLLDGAPNWETRFLARTLARDPQVELTSISALGTRRVRMDGVVREQPRRVVRTGSASTGASITGRLNGLVDAETLSRFDVVVFGDQVHTLISVETARAFASNLADRGGSAVFLRSPPAPSGSAHAEALEAISPVAWGEALAEAGSLAPGSGAAGASPIESIVSGDILTELPGMRAVTRTDGPRAFSSVWLEHRSGDAPPRAALAHARIGRGQSLVLLSRGLWRWAMTAGTLDEHDAVYREFWARTVRWLALGGDFLPGQALRLRADRVFASPGDAVAVTVRGRTPSDVAGGLLLERISPDGSVTPVPLAQDPGDRALRRATVVPREEGVHTLRLRTPDADPPEQTVRLAVHDDREELRDTSADRALLERIAALAGGEVIEPGETAQLIDLLERDSVARAETGGVTGRSPLWDSPWLFAIIALLLLSEWIMKRGNA